MSKPARCSKVLISLLQCLVRGDRAHETLLVLKLNHWGLEVSLDLL